MQPFIDSLIAFLPRLGAAILIFVVFWIAGYVIARITKRFGISRRLSPDLITLMSQLSIITMLLFGAVTALGTVGVNVGPIIAGLGLAGFAIGFALKDLLSNFLAGFLILIYHPFVRGDHITVAANQGRVIEINMRYTVLDSEDKKILIPNSTLFSNPVIVEHKVPAPPGGIQVGE